MDPLPKTAAFLEELNALCSKHGLWITAPYEALEIMQYDPQESVWDETKQVGE
jgi:hypothetical protein